MNIFKRQMNISKPWENAGNILYIKEVVQQVFHLILILTYACSLTLFYSRD